MPRTTAQTAAMVKKAMSSDNKSDGMRILLDAGMTVAEIKEATGEPYGFIYGVAKRNGNITPTERAPRAAKAPAAKATASKAKTAPKAPARAKAPAKAASKSKARAKA